MPHQAATACVAFAVDTPLSVALEQHFNLQQAARGKGVGDACYCLLQLQAGFNHQSSVSKTSRQRGGAKEIRERVRERQTDREIEKCKQKGRRLGQLQLRADPPADRRTEASVSCSLHEASSGRECSSKAANMQVGKAS